MSRFWLAGFVYAMTLHILSLGFSSLAMAVLPNSNTAPRDAVEFSVDELAVDPALAATLVELKQAATPAEALQGWRAQGRVPLPVGGGFLVVSDQFAGIVGDFNGWRPEPMRLLRNFHAGTGGTLRGFVIPPSTSGSGEGYKFVNAAGNFVADPLAGWHRFDQHGELSLSSRPARGAALFRHWSVPTDGRLKARWVTFRVPAGNGPWPLLIMHDGQNLFNPAGPFGGWRVDDAVTAVGRDVLVAGIDNTDQRMAEYTHADDSVGGTVIASLGASYAGYVTSEVLPLARRLFPTLEQQAGILGSSLGGLVSLWTAWLYPDDYVWAGSMSGTLGWGRFSGDAETLVELWRQSPPSAGFFYVDTGGALKTGRCPRLLSGAWTTQTFRDSDNYCVNAELDRLMRPIMASRLKYAWQPNAEHNEAAWAARLPQALRDFFRAIDAVFPPPGSP